MLNAGSTYTCSERLTNKTTKSGMRSWTRNRSGYTKPHLCWHPRAPHTCRPQPTVALARNNAVTMSWALDRSNCQLWLITWVRQSMCNVWFLTILTDMVETQHFDTTWIQMRALLLLCTCGMARRVDSVAQARPKFTELNDLVSERVSTPLFVTQWRKLVTHPGAHWPRKTPLHTVTPSHSTFRLLLI
jgi:hypothetical protein